MDTLQSALNKVLLDTAYQAFATTIAEKLAAQGLTLTTRERDRLAEYLRSDATDTIHFRRWRWWENRNLTIEVTEEEAEAVHSRFTQFLESQLSGLIDSAIEDLSANILQTLNRSWAAESRRQNRELRGFERRLHRHWGQAIDRLRMSVVVAREFGDIVSTGLRSDPDFDRPSLLEVLTRLHARACQVTGEIVCLLAAGFADGAMARWRTLHEIAVVAFFLKEDGEDLAKRYIDHQVVESFRAASDYRDCSERLGYEPMSESEFDEVRQAFEKAVKRYGAPFKTQYGWAADTLDLKQPTLRDIERTTGIDHLRAHYRMASHNVHANPKGVFFKLGLVDETDILLAGPSNAGLADPGHSAAISLMHVSTALGLIQPTLDSLVALRVLARLEDEVGDAFTEAHRQLEDAVG